MDKKLTSIRLTQDAANLIDKLVNKLGLSKTAVIELAVRELAKKWGIK